MTQSSSSATLPNLSFVSDHPHPVAADVFMTYFAAQVHLAFNNDLRPSPNRIIEVSRRLGITRQQCLLLLKSGKFPASPLVAFPKLTTDADYHQHLLASPDDYCVVAVSNVIEKIKEFPEAKKDVFDKLPEMLLAFDQTLSSAPLTDKTFWSYKGIALFLRSFFLEDHVTTSAGGLVGVAAKGSRRAGCSVQLTRS